MVFADSSGLIATFDRRDPYHARARAVWQALARQSERVVLTELVFAEVVTHLRRRSGYELARQIGDAVRTSRVLELVAPDRADVDAAWREFVRNGTPRLSLCDALSFVVMRDRRITRAFTFDEDFRAAGFQLLP